VCFRAALGVLTDLGDRFGEALLLQGLGELEPDPEKGRALLEASLRLWRELRMLCAARALDRLGLVHAAAGDQEAAEASWRQALAIFEAVGAPEAAAVADRLTT
jgi:hypothetical protein